MSELLQTPDTAPAPAPISHEAKADAVADLLLGGSDDTPDSTEQQAAASEANINGNTTDFDDDLLIEAAKEVASEEMEPAEPAEPAEPEPTPVPEQPQPQQVSPDLQQVMNQVDELMGAKDELVQLLQNNRISQEQYQHGMANADAMNQQLLAQGNQLAAEQHFAQQQQYINQQQQQINHQRGVELEHEQLTQQFPELKDRKVYDRAGQQMHNFLSDQGFTDQEIAGVQGTRAISFIYKQMKAQQKVSEQPMVDAARRRTKRGKKPSKLAGLTSELQSRPLSQEQQIDQVAHLLSGI